MIGTIGAVVQITQSLQRFFGNAVLNSTVANVLTLFKSNLFKRDHTIFQTHPDLLFHNPNFEFRISRNLLKEYIHMPIASHITELINLWCCATLAHAVPPTLDDSTDRCILIGQTEKLEWDGV